MRSSVRTRDAAVWDVARPQRPSRVAGVTMAGFRDRGMTHGGYRLVPHPAVTLALDFGAAPPVVYDATGRQHRGSLVAGLGFGLGAGSRSGPGPGGAVWGRGEKYTCVQVRLPPVVAGRVLGVCPADLEGAVVSLDELWGREASRICEQLGEAPSWEERFALTDALLARRCAAGPPVDPEVAWVWGRMAGSRGLVRIDELVAELGWSRKRLWSRFRTQLGLPPKRAAQLIRFDHAAHRLAAGQDAAGVAADSGYTDQSHLHREVVAFTGATPATVAGEPFLAIDDLAWPGQCVPVHRPRP